jgi:hypothetical protein
MFLQKCTAPGCGRPCAICLEEEHDELEQFVEGSQSRDGLLHRCQEAEEGCPIKCLLCPNKCASTDHYHAADGAALHICADEHVCSGECESCAAGFFPGLRGPQFKKVTCSIPIARGQLRHKGPHTCQQPHVNQSEFVGRCRGRCLHCYPPGGAPDDNGDADSCSYRCSYRSTYDQDGEEEAHLCLCPQHSVCGRPCQKKGAGHSACRWVAASSLYSRCLYCSTPLLLYYSTALLLSLPRPSNLNLKP